MENTLQYFKKLGHYAVGLVLIWLGLVGLLDVGFTTITTLPLIEVGYVARIVFALQIVIGLGIFNSSVQRFAKPIAIVYFLLLAYNIYISYGQMFEPAIPYLSDYGREVFLEILLIFAGYNYLK